MPSKKRSKKTGIKKKNAGRAKKKVAIMLAMTAVIFIFATIAAFFITKNPTPKVNYYAIREVPINLTVGPPMYVGIGSIKGGNVLFFGTIPPGSMGYREIQVTNNEKFPLKIIVAIAGEASRFVTSSENNITINPGKSAIVHFVAAIPWDATQENITGTAIVGFSRES
jgi:hypothetical protein